MVGLVVEAGEVEETVKEEDAELGGEGVAVLGGLAGGGVEGDGEVAGVRGGNLGCCREAEDVGGSVFARKVRLRRLSSASVVRRTETVPGRPTAARARLRKRVSAGL